MTLFINKLLIISTTIPKYKNTKKNDLDSFSTIIEENFLFFFSEIVFYIVFLQNISAVYAADSLFVIRKIEIKIQ